MRNVLMVVQLMGTKEEKGALEEVEVEVVAVEERDLQLSPKHEKIDDQAPVSGPTSTCLGWV